jgi:hypothetical protein
MRSPSSLAIALVAGCTGTSSIGSSPDAKVDAIVYDADLHGTVTVTALSLLGDGTPEAGATVLITDGDGTRTATTDDTGATTATVLPGATLTVARRTSGGSQIATVVGVDPGDAIVFGKRPPADAPVRGEMTFAFTEASGATQHTVYNGCDDADGRSTGVPVRFGPGCGSGPHDILLVARNDTGTVMAWDSLLDVAFAAGTTRTIPAPLQTPATFTATYSDLPVEAQFLATTRTCYHEGRAYAEIGAPSVASGTGRTSTLRHPPFGDRMGVTTLVGLQADTAGPIQTLIERVPAAATFAMAVRPALLPWVQDVAYDIAARRLSWTLTGDNSADAVVIRVVHDTTEPAGHHEWWLIAPPDATAVELPQLPTELADLAPVVATRPAVKVQLVEVGHRSSYAEFRQAAEPDGVAIETLHDIDRVRISTTDMLITSP